MCWDNMRVSNNDPVVTEEYEILRQRLGSGDFAIVNKCRNKKTGESAAVKTIRKSRVKHPEYLESEIAILKQIQHPHILQMHNIYENRSCLYIVTELCSGGTLFDTIYEQQQRGEGYFNEADAGRMIGDVLQAVRYLHDDLFIVHRDLKAENLMFAQTVNNNTSKAQLKIIDFGLSRQNGSRFEVMTKWIGTLLYTAPEVMARHYNCKCDIWSIGIVTYSMLSGCFAFHGDNTMDTIDQVKHTELDFPLPEWSNISELAKSFISSLLQKDPTQRPTAEEALKHPWIVQYVDIPKAPTKQRQLQPALDKMGKMTERLTRQRVIAATDSLGEFTRH